MADILIVEDEAIVALENKMNLMMLGHNVVAITSTAEAAINAFHENIPDLILLDIILKGEMDGIEAITEIRKHSSVPVIFITGNSDTKTLERVCEISNIIYLQKPILLHELTNAVDTMLSKNSSPQAV
jgi:DNA-binding response OmpR family regulator